MIGNPNALTIPKSDPKEVTAASLLIPYIAGLFDGEGCVKIHIAQGKRQVNPSFSLIIEITSTFKPIIVLLQEALGGHLYIKDRRDEGCKTGYFLTWCADEAQKILEMLLPYLVIKKEIAELGIAFQDVKHLKTTSRNSSVPKWQLEILGVMHDKARQLNLKGAH